MDHYFQPPQRCHPLSPQQQQQQQHQYPPHPHISYPVASPSSTPEMSLSPLDFSTQPHAVISGTRGSMTAVSEHSYATAFSCSKRGRDSDDLDSSEEASSSLSLSTSNNEQSMYARRIGTIARRWPLPSPTTLPSLSQASSSLSNPPIVSPATPHYCTPKKSRANSYIAPRQIPKTIVSTLGSLVAADRLPPNPLLLTPHDSAPRSTMRPTLRRQLSGGQVEPFLSTCRTGSTSSLWPHPADGAPATHTNPLGRGDAPPPTLSHQHHQHSSPPFLATNGSHRNPCPPLSPNMFPISSPSTNGSGWPMPLHHHQHQQQHQLQHQFQPHPSLSSSSSSSSVPHTSMDCDDSGLFNPNRIRSMSF